VNPEPRRRKVPNTQLQSVLEAQRVASLERFRSAIERGDLGSPFGMLIGWAQSVKQGDHVNLYAVERLHELGELWREHEAARRAS